MASSAPYDLFGLRGTHKQWVGGVVRVSISVSPLLQYREYLTHYPTTTNTHQIIELVAELTPRGPYGLSHMHRSMSQHIWQSWYVSVEISILTHR